MKKTVLLLLVLIASTQFTNAQSDATLDEVKDFVEQKFRLENYVVTGNTISKLSNTIISITGCDCRISYDKETGSERSGDVFWNRKYELYFSLSDLTTEGSKIGELSLGSGITINNEKIFSLIFNSKNDYKDFKQVIHKRDGSLQTNYFKNREIMWSTNKELLERIEKAFSRGIELCQRKDKF
ncbi:hypothetical protein A9Q86_09915 [Flavobacteriales bacterium 33_180_T64]|nr:hypothetical protein A9Q86_09915 [Flavobacteriales bacterium 33_180_T64]